MDDFQIVQQQFTEAIRHQTDNPFEQIKPERFAVYSRLIRNNISNFVSQGFPVLKVIAGGGVQSSGGSLYCRSPCQLPLLY